MKEVMDKSKTTQIALIITQEQGSPVLRDTLTSDSEIEFLIASMAKGELDPLGEIHRYRSHVEQQQTIFGDYVEDLLSKPFVEGSLQQQALKWLGAKIKIDQFQLQEKAAAKIISDYAYKLFKVEPAKNDFFIESAHFRIRVRIFTLPKVLIA
jgi:hypothetical protein